MARYVALLRGINVGGNNLIRMTDLKDCFSALGLRDAATYIASGNVVFSAARDQTAVIERALQKRFGFAIPVVVRSEPQLKRIVEDAPAGFGRDPAKRRYDVIFLKKPLTAAKALAVVPRKGGVDEVMAGDGVLYYSRLTARAAQSRLSRVVLLPEYKSMTIRNWNTATKLLALLQSPSAAA